MDRGVGPSASVPVIGQVLADALRAVHAGSVVGHERAAKSKWHLKRAELGRNSDKFTQEFSPSWTKIEFNPMKIHSNEIKTNE